MKFEQNDCWFYIAELDKLEQFLETQTVSNQINISIIFKNGNLQKFISKVELVFSVLPECGTGYAYLPISLIGARHIVENPRNCLELCNSSEDCNFWHYDGFESCSLFISGEKRTRFVDGRYSYGSKYCTFSGV